MCATMEGEPTKQPIEEDVDDVNNSTTPVNSTPTATTNNSNANSNPNSPPTQLNFKLSHPLEQQQPSQQQQQISQTNNSSHAASSLDYLISRSSSPVPHIPIKRLKQDKDDTRDAIAKPLSRSDEIEDVSDRRIPSEMEEEGQTIPSFDSIKMWGLSGPQKNNGTNSDSHSQYMLPHFHSAPSFPSSGPSSLDFREFATPSTLIPSPTSNHGSPTTPPSSSSGNNSNGNNPNNNSNGVVSNNSNGQLPVLSSSNGTPSMHPSAMGQSSMSSQFNPQTRPLCSVCHIEVGRCHASDPISMQAFFTSVTTLEGPLSTQDWLCMKCYSRWYNKCKRRQNAAAAASVGDISGSNYGQIPSSAPSSPGGYYSSMHSMLPQKKKHDLMDSPHSLHPSMWNPLLTHSGYNVSSVSPPLMPLPLHGHHPLIMRPMPPSSRPLTPSVSFPPPRSSSAISPHTLPYGSPPPIPHANPYTRNSIVPPLNPLPSSHSSPSLSPRHANYVQPQPQSQPQQQQPSTNPSPAPAPITIPEEEPLSPKPQSNPTSNSSSTTALITPTTSTTTTSTNVTNLSGSASSITPSSPPISSPPSPQMQQVEKSTSTSTISTSTITITTPSGHVSQPSTTPSSPTRVPTPAPLASSTSAPAVLTSVENEVNELEKMRSQIQKLQGEVHRLQSELSQKEDHMELILSFVKNEMSSMHTFIQEISASVYGPPPQNSRPQTPPPHDYSMHSHPSHSYYAASPHSYYGTSNSNGSISSSANSNNNNNNSSNNTGQHSSPATTPTLTSPSIPLSQTTATSHFATRGTKNLPYSQHSFRDII
eukprot:TRINITY_DN6007_c0_g1_i2.p1 TRINITY_DN6007_c0_g1~~TRINITY_DN6007_c0_g1_i2.p1  ORF type:complete len:814 (-),score=202.27 TRINITY_DN6007_c0_g1_i2:185-2626(-)